MDSYARFVARIVAAIGHDTTGSNKRAEYQGFVASRLYGTHTHQSTGDLQLQDKYQDPDCSYLHG